MHGGKRVVGNLWACRGYSTNEGAFAGIGQSKQANVGKYAQLKTQVTFLARFAFCALARGAIDAGFEVDVTKAAAPARNTDGSGRTSTTNQPTTAVTILQRRPTGTLVISGAHNTNMSATFCPDTTSRWVSPDRKKRSRCAAD